MSLSGGSVTLLDVLGVAGLACLVTGLAWWYAERDRG